MPDVTEENPFASPQGLDEVEIEVEVVEPVEGSAKRRPPPDSIQVAWVLALVLIPIQFAIFGLLGIFLILPLIGVLGYLPTPRPWIRNVALGFFFVDAVLMGVALCVTFLSGQLPLSLMLLLGLVGCLTVNFCLSQRSARDYYHREAY